MKLALVFVVSYILGSVPFGLIIGKTFCGVDIRKFGSGNIGATNVLRALGPKPAAAVFAADVLKGLLPVVLAKSMFPQVPWIVVVSGMVAILGHTFSIFLNFKGGKGVATSLGVIIGLDPRVAGIAFALWVIVVAFTKYVSLASILAAVSIPVLMHVFHAPIEYQILSLVASVFVIAKHRSNMTRLLQGKEAKWGEKVKVTEGKHAQRDPKR